MIVKSKKSTLDIATQVSGDARSVLEFCFQNNISITDDLTPSSVVEIKEYEYTNSIVQYSFFSTEYELATAISKENKELFGIGSMVVEDDFIVT